MINWIISAVLVLLVSLLIYVTKGFFLIYAFGIILVAVAIMVLKYTLDDIFGKRQ